MRRSILLMLATLFVLSSLVCAETRIVVVSHGQANDPFWSVVKNGVDQAAKDMGVRVEYRAPDTFDVVRMAQLIDAAVASKPDGLVVSIPDKDALGKSIRGAVDAGISVVSMNSGAEVRKELGALIHVGQSEYEAGKGAGERFKGAKKGLCINHEQGNVALDQRCDGFRDGLGAEVQMLGVSTDPTEIRNAVIAYLNRNREVDVILAVGPVGSEPTLAALRELGAIGIVKMGSFDLSPVILKALQDGEMAFAIDQQQYLQGYLPVVMLALHAKYGLMPGADVHTGPGFVTPQTASQVIELSKQGIR